MRFVYATAHGTEYFPPDYLDRCKALEPAIYVAWHANLQATPLLAPDLTRLVNLTSPHPDGRDGGGALRSLRHHDDRRCRRQLPGRRERRHRRLPRTAAGAA